MFYISNKINYNNIIVNYLHKKKIYKLYYYLNKDIKLIGIPINLKYDCIKKKYNLYYIYFQNNDILDSINNNIYNWTKVNIIKYNNVSDQYYIICKKTNNDIYTKESVNINISKIIYVNNRYVPLVYII